MPEEIDKLKRLSAEERLKKLKEYSEKREKEISEAQKLMQRSEEEIDQKKKFEEKIPIPQLITDTGETLTTSEERDMFKVHRLKGEAWKEDEKPIEKESLEETVAQEPIQRELTNAAQYSEALAEASMRPVHEFYTELTQINQAAEERGYLTRDQMERVAYIDTVTEKKQEADYTPTETAEREINLVHKISEKLQGVYKRQGDNAERQKHGYSFSDKYAGN